jgi:hypothetical protein
VDTTALWPNVPLGEEAKEREIEPPYATANHCRITLVVVGVVLWLINTYIDGW